MAKNEFVSFFKKISILSLLITAVYYLIIFIIKLPFNFHFIGMVVFFSAVNLIVFYILLKSIEKNFSKFMANFMSATFIKLIIYVSVLLLFVFTNPINARMFVVEYFLLYLIYTVFEVLSISKISNQNK